MIPHPVMENDVKSTADLYRLVAWAHARRKQLIWISTIVVVAAAIIGIYIWRTNYNENLASESLSRLKLPTGSETITASAADPYIKVVNDFPGTRAGARALLMAAGILFDSGKFKEAQDQFDRFMREYSDSPLVSQALIGIAASLEAQGKIPEATARYEDITKRRSLDSTMPQANSALARLYLAQNKPDRAFKIYKELAQSGNPDSWSSEAGIQAEELLQKYPDLRKSMMTMPPPSASPTPTAPALNLPKK
jgi:predicted negative regulator of RcsB-dependent stress response